MTSGSQHGPGLNGDPPAGSAGFTVASLNLHYGRNAHGAPFDVAEACRSLAADVIALQEVWWPDEEPGMVEGLRELGYEVVELPLTRAAVVPKLRVHEDGEHNTGWWGIALASRLPVAASTELGIGRVLRDPAGARSALRIEVECGAGERVSVTNVHATHFVPLSPLHHVRLARTLSGEQRHVLVGDFNIWGPLTGVLYPGWVRPVRGRTYPAHRPHSQIDHLLTSRDLGVDRAEVLAEVGSDHRPIRARISVPPRQVVQT